MFVANAIESNDYATRWANFCLCAESYAALIAFNAYLHERKVCVQCAV